jgi:hypothetical protein
MDFKFGRAAIMLMSCDMFKRLMGQVSEFDHFKRCSLMILGSRHEDAAVRFVVSIC